jgi:hypothetical protein
MHLLYCLNGLVVGIHDDTQPFADPASYGTGTRIIPWNYPLGDLTLSGPVDPDLPPPPYLQPTETPDILKAFAAQLRYLASIGGLDFTAGGGLTIPVETGRTNAALINNLATFGSSKAPTDPINFTQNNINYPITVQDSIDMFNTIISHVQDCRNIEANCIADQNLATPTLKTYADVEAQFSSVTARTLRGKKAAKAA